MHFLYTCEHATLKAVKVISRRGKGKNNGGDDSNQGTLFTYGNVTMKLSVQLLYTNKNIFKREKEGSCLFLLPCGDTERRCH
jgi:hypothetical protein